LCVATRGVMINASKRLGGTCAFESARALHATCTFAAALSSMEEGGGSRFPPEAGLGACTLTTCAAGAVARRTRRLRKGHAKQDALVQIKRTHPGTASAETPSDPTEVAGAGWLGRGRLRHLWSSPLRRRSGQRNQALPATGSRCNRLCNRPGFLQRAQVGDIRPA